MTLARVDFPPPLGPVCLLYTSFRDISRQRRLEPPTCLARELSQAAVSLAEGCWNSLYLNNHDQPRMVSRYGDDGRCV